MNFIHASMRSCISICYIIQKWIQTFSQDKCSAQVSPVISFHVMFANTWKASPGYPFRWRPSPWDWSSPNPPLLMTLSLGMVRSLCSPFGQRPSPWEQSSPGYNHFLGNGQIVGRIKTLCSIIVIESFHI